MECYNHSYYNILSYFNSIRVLILSHTERRIGFTSSAFCTAYSSNYLIVDLNLIFYCDKCVVHLYKVESGVKSDIGCGDVRLGLGLSVRGCGLGCGLSGGVDDVDHLCLRRRDSRR